MTIVPSTIIDVRIIIATGVGGRLEACFPGLQALQTLRSSVAMEGKQDDLGHGPDFIAIRRGFVNQKHLQDQLGPSGNEAGCQSDELFQDEENPLDFVTIAHWAEQAASDAHTVTPHVAAAIAKAAPLLAQPPIIHRCTPIA